MRQDNPTTGVLGPETGERKSKQYLWPSEFVTLVTSPRVPLRWRRLFALAIYCYARAGELEALKSEDVDLEHRVIHVHRSIDRVRKKGTVTSTKSGRSRKVPIEAELLPLLKALSKESGGEGAVFDMPSAGVLSSKLKHYIERAGITRGELLVTDATRKGITFHDLRATGITWMAARGDEPLRIMQRAGHASFSTTMLYVREAENLGAHFGVPFPPLPADLLGGDSSPDSYEPPVENSNDPESLANVSGADENRTPQGRFRETQAERGLDLQPLEIALECSFRPVPPRSVPFPRWLQGHGNLTATESAAI